MSKNSYQSIFKSTALFGSVQVFSILINIIRTKIIAVLLGPVGVGISALLTSTIGLVGTFTNFGLTTSAVKNIAAAHGTGDDAKVSRTVTIFRRWVWITGTLGFVAALLLSPLLSKMAFGNTSYTLSFILISVTLLITQISAGQGVILRGLRRIKDTAKSDTIGAAVGLVSSAILYYLWGAKGIVPAIIISALTALALTWYFSKKVTVKDITLSFKEVFEEGREMLYMGFMLSLSGLITTGTAYLVRVFVSKTGSVADVGLYNAGFAIINSYVGLIFTAMSKDYYPRLAGAAHDVAAVDREINQQAEIALLIMAPILCICLLYIDAAVILLYSNKFLAIKNMLQWVALGMFFEAASWVIAFLVLAKGDSKVFF